MRSEGFECLREAFLDVGCFIVLANTQNINTIVLCKSTLTKEPNESNNDDNFDDDNGDDNNDSSRFAETIMMKKMMMVLLVSCSLEKQTCLSDGD